MKEIFKVTDMFNGKEYCCSSKKAVKKVIADISGLPKDDEAVEEAANGYSESFNVESVELYTAKD